jgi:hypothetical protein
MTTYTKAQQAENRAKWVAALRSGQYQQGKEWLQNDAGYCCLGVACDLAVVDGVALRLRVAEGEWGFKGVNDPASSVAERLLPAAVEDWLGLYDSFATTRQDVRDNDDFTYSALTEFNDNLEWDFDQIADLIEADGLKLAGESDA